MDKLEIALDKLADISDYEKNWDGKGSPPVDILIRAYVDATLRSILTQPIRRPEIYAVGPDNRLSENKSASAIVLEWNNEQRNVIFEFVDPDTLFYFKFRNEEIVERGTLDFHYDRGFVNLMIPIISWCLEVEDGNRTENLNSK